ncbi:hypothetical protein E2C01_081425 [Portunus trituberculatus]|uniref:Uncharacterized protein n=1 Tax=Portunus trituberculatus TaxID=210409 RepID=A0A5B7IM78_PORTR|nr:hypothetical protein [Portunus trituberculatus]
MPVLGRAGHVGKRNGAERGRVGWGGAEQDGMEAEVPEGIQHTPGQLFLYSPVRYVNIKTTPFKKA